MNWKRIWVMFIARTREFYRDRSAFGWNFVFPFLIIIGFNFIFGNDNSNQYKFGIFPHPSGKINPMTLHIPQALANNKQLEFIGFPTYEQGINKLRHHRIDLLLQLNDSKPSYWISNTSPKGAIAEHMLNSALAAKYTKNLSEKKLIEGVEIKYIDWLFPGILTMNMMFSALWGIGWVIVRYRKNGVLKRLKATPLTAYEYFTAQMLSRIFVIMFSLAIVWIGCDLIFKFRTVGSYRDIFIVLFLGGLSFCAIGMLLAARGTSEEFVSGIINFITMPMMFLSEVWFSLEGAPGWVQTVSKFLPLTHINNAIRKIMHDGARLVDIRFEITVLIACSAICLLIGGRLFKWNK